MSELNVVSHSPTVNATGVYRNAPINVVFNRSIEPNTATWETISVNDASTFSTVPGNLDVVWHSGGYVKEVSFIPSKNLTANTQYDVYVFGKPQGIVGKNGEELQETYTWSFVTGTGYITTTASGGVPTGVSPSPVFPTLSGIPSDQQSSITTFQVYSTDPKNQEPNHDITLDKINIIFTGNVLTSLTDMSGYVTIKETPVLE